MAGAHLKRRVRVGRNRGGHPRGGLRVGAVAAEIAGQFLYLGRGEPAEHPLF
jgi:hypothetical protein